MKKLIWNRKKSVLIVVIIFVVSIVGSLSVGSENIGFSDVVRVLISKFSNVEVSDSISSIIWELRFPRILLAIMIGGALSVSGACLQSVLKNPIASPYTLGISSGASFFVGIIIILNLSITIEFAIPIVGFLGGILTIFAVLFLSNRLDDTLSNDTIILVGIILSLFINSILILLTSIFHTEITKIVMWQMGSLGLKDWNYVFVFLPFLILGLFFISFYSKEMDILSLDNEKVKSLGVNIRKVKIIIIIFTSILIGSAVSISGVIGFVGLIVPHIVRKIYGCKHKVVIPFSFIFGGIFLLISDILSRALIYPSEIPIGAITSCIGAPFFAVIFFLKRKK